jgi:hypothetical protein
MSTPQKQISLKDVSNFWKDGSEVKKTVRGFQLQPVSFDQMDSFNFKNAFVEAKEESPLFEKLSIHQQNMVSPLWNRLDDIFPRDSMARTTSVRGNSNISWMDILQPDNEQKN